MVKNTLALNPGQSTVMVYFTVPASYVNPAVIVWILNFERLNFAEE